MIRVEFKLTTPSKGSWDNRWSGENRNYTRVKELDNERALQLDGRSWSYGWSDGWRAQVRAHALRANEEPSQSHGFHGYDWMVDSILYYGKIYADHERPETVP